MALRQRSFFGTLHSVLGSDLITTLTRTMALWAQERFPVRLLPTPIGAVTYDEELVWHERFDSDPAHQWFRGHLSSASNRIQSRLDR